MLEPVNIVALLVIRPVMRPTAFLPGESAGNDGLRDIEEGLELEGLHEIRIKHQPFILHRNGGGAMSQCGECRDRTRHGFVGPNEAKIEAHQLAEFFPNLPGSDRSFLCQQALDPTLLDCELVCCECPWRDGSSILSGSSSGAPAEDNRLKERVASKPIGAVDTDAGTFTSCVEAGDVRFGPLIGPNTAHLIVRAWSDRNGSLDRIKAGKLNREFSDLREPFENAPASKVS
jgi:hypothetical protein